MSVPVKRGDEILVTGTLPRIESCNSVAHRGI